MVQLFYTTFIAVASVIFGWFAYPLFAGAELPMTQEVFWNYEHLQILGLCFGIGLLGMVFSKLHDAKLMNIANEERAAKIITAGKKDDLEQQLKDKTARMEWVETIIARAIRETPPPKSLKDYDDEYNNDHFVQLLNEEDQK